jgi:nickel-dependent lactate racemase
VRGLVINPMKIPLKYGRGEIEIDLPDETDVSIIRKPAMPVLPDPAMAIATALDQPVSSPCLEVAAATASTACIAICDITRPVPNHLFLRPIIERLISAGMNASAITVIVATGLHRPNEGDELAELVGDPWVLENVNVVNHFARNDDDHVRLGETPTRGTVVRIDRRFVDADIRIATGLVEPHFMAGYSGGRKLIAPGLAHAETITTFHSARFMADPAAANCNFAGNPLHEEQLEIVRMLGGALALNVVIDEDRNLSFVNFGEIVESHAESVNFVRDYCEVSVPRQFQTVVTSAAGYPLDKTYYQTVKGMVGAMDILAPGGDLIIASECSEGMGSAEFVAAQQRLVQQGPDAFLQSILEKSHADIDEWQTQMQLKPMSVGNIYLFSDALRSSDHRTTGVTVTRSIDDAITGSLKRNRDNAVAVIPEGPYVVPFYRPTVHA